MSLVIGEKIPTFNHIEENVYLGDVESAQSKELLSKHQIKIIVNISNSRYREYEDIQYHQIDIEDDKDVSIHPYFDFVNQLIEENKEKNILIHCMNSVSRSVTLVLQYLMQKRSLKDSYLYLISKREQYTRPNRGFLKQLIEKEKELYQIQTMKYHDFYQK